MCEKLRGSISISDPNLKMCPFYKGDTDSKAFSIKSTVVCDIKDTLSNLIQRDVVRVSASMKYTRIIFAGIVLK